MLMFSISLLQDVQFDHITNSSYVRDNVQWAGHYCKTTPDRVIMILTQSWVLYYPGVVYFQIMTSWKVHYPT